MNTADVLVVGAGPVGLSAALGLAKSGIRVRIIDKLAVPTNQSRAAIVHARTAEHFQRLGIVEDFLAEGVKVHGVAIYGPHEKLLARPSLDHLPTPFPFMIGLEQFKTEEILTKHLSQLGVTVERSVELLNFEDDGTKVNARLRLPDGVEETASFGWIIGCDGGHSTVRAQLGLHLEGETLDATWLTADVKIKWNRPSDEAIGCLTPQGIVFIAAMNDDRWRVIVNLPDSTPEEAHKATVEDVEKVVIDRLGGTMSFYDPVWISAFGLNTRLAGTMNVGRIFLAGDAAHVHSPVGGQGMNTGIQDALNLAWKLALVIKGLAKPALLASYNAERHANAKKLLSRVGPATKMANLRNPLAIEVRNHFIHLMGSIGLTKLMPYEVSMLTVGYPDSPIVSKSEHQWIIRGPRSGERAALAGGLLLEGDPEPRDIFDLWAGNERHQLLVFGEAAVAVPHSPLYDVWHIVRDGEPSGNTVVDSHGEVFETYGVPHEGMHYLVRPDGIVAFRHRGSDFTELAHYLATWFAT